MASTRFSGAGEFDSTRLSRRREYPRILDSPGPRRPGSLPLLPPNAYGLQSLMERTFILLKPDCVQRRLMGRIITRFEDKGLNVIAMKMLQITPELAKQHYAEHVQKGWYPTLEGFITGGPVLAAVLEGLEAIRVVREMLGATNGLNAAPGTIRGDYSSSRQMNLVHGSDGPEAAAREIALYFKKEELVAYEPTITKWMRASDEN
jgi:nucleoside-diphosphate kinase